MTAHHVRRVLVTGAASGLGAALVTAFRARGDEVLATDRVAADGIDLVLDITSDDDWSAAVDAVRSRWGGLDVLVNNAGVAGGGRVDRCTLDEWQWITEINLFGLVRGTKAFVPMLKEQGSGHLVNVASLAGLVHPGGMGSYNATKAAVVAFTETCGHELSVHGIRASVVCPSYFRTNLMDSMQGSDELVGQVIGGLVDRSRVSADEIAAAVLAGIDAGDDVIVPDESARLAYYLKWADRPAYDAMMRDQAAKLQAAEGGGCVVTAVPGARDVREEDAFDVARVSEWIRSNAAAPGTVEGSLDGDPEVRQFTGGASNLTYLLRYPSGRDLIVRRAPQGTKAKGAHDMHREYVIQSALAPVFDYVAPMVAFCDDADVVGGDFYAMDRVVGVIPRSEWPEDVPLSPEQARALCLDAVDVLAELHDIDPDAAGLTHLGRGLGYVRRQVEGWSTRYRNARTDDVPDLESVMAWLAAHQPDDVAVCVIHNDFKLDNLVLDPDDVTRVVGVLDWEMATLGDPLMDLAGSMAYWVQADDSEEFQMMRRVPTHLLGMLTRDEFVAAYAERTGRVVTPEQWRFYEVFGLFRMAAIAQQIYYRYFHGQTSNEMYALFGPAVQIIGRRLDGLIEGSA